MQEGRGRAVRSPAVGREGLQAVEETLDAARVAGGLVGVEEAPDDGEGAGAPQNTERYSSNELVVYRSELPGVV